jgi:hypothetical protein
VQANGFTQQTGADENGFHVSSLRFIAMPHCRFTAAWRILAEGCGLLQKQPLLA